MLRGFIREELRSLCSRLGDDQGASVLNQGTKIITVHVNLGGEAGAEVEEDMIMIDTVEGKETLIEAEAAVLVLMVINIVEEIDMTMIGAVEVVLMEVHLLLDVAIVQGRAHRPELLPRMEAQMLGITLNGLLLQKVCHHVDVRLIHAVNLPVMMWMTEDKNG